MKKQAQKTRVEIFDDLFGKLVYMNHQQLKEVAEEAKVSIATLYNWISGKTYNPHINTLVKVATTLGYDIRLVKTRKLRLVA